MANAARRFSPTFIATVTPASVDTRTGKNGKYAVLQGAKIERPNGEIITRTVLAFGETRDLLASHLHKDRPVTVKVRHDGGTLQIVALHSNTKDPAEKAKPRQQATKEHSTRASKVKTMLDACVEAAGYSDHYDYAAA